MAKARTRTKTKIVKKSGAETNLVRRVTMKEMNKTIPTFHPGDTVGVYVKVKEGEKERVQLYKGLVTKIQGSGVARSFTVRKVSAGVGVERTFPFRSPALDKIELVSTGKVRRAKLYYLRDLDGKAAKIESELVNQEDSAAEAPATKAETASAETKA